MNVLPCLSHHLAGHEEHRVDEVGRGPGKKPLLVFNRIPCAMALKVSSVTRIQLPHNRLMRRLP